MYVPLDPQAAVPRFNPAFPCLSASSYSPLRQTPPPFHQSKHSIATELALHTYVVTYLQIGGQCMQCAGRSTSYAEQAGRHSQICTGGYLDFFPVSSPPHHPPCQRHHLRIESWPILGVHDPQPFRRRQGRKRSVAKMSSLFFHSIPHPGRQLIETPQSIFATLFLSLLSSFAPPFPQPAATMRHLWSAQPSLSVSSHPPSPPPCCHASPHP